MKPSVHFPRLRLIKKDIQTSPQFKLTTQTLSLHNPLQSVFLLVNKLSNLSSSLSTMCSEQIDQRERLNLGMSLRNASATKSKIFPSMHADSHHCDQ